MSLNGTELEKLIFGTPRLRRFTQDSPVLPDVWLAYNEDPGKPADLLLTPYRDGNPAELYRALRARLPGRGDRGLTYNTSYVVVRLTFAELIRSALPLTKWWSRYVWPEARRATGPRPPEAEKPLAPVEEGLPTSPPADPHQVLRERIRRLQDPSIRQDLVARIERRRGEDSGKAPAPARTRRRPVVEEPADLNPSSDLLWMIEIVGSLAAAPGKRPQKPRLSTAVKAFQELIAGIELEDLPQEPLLWAVNCNRRARSAVWKSALACKADAARLLFQISCKDLRWAVIDSGIDATHPAFRRRDPKSRDPKGPDLYPHWLGKKGENQTRVAETYDFTMLRSILDLEKKEDDVVKEGRRVLRFNMDDRKRLTDVRKAVEEGRMLDWNYLADLIRVRVDEKYEEGRIPANPHGTHVAGVLAGDWKVTDAKVAGIPDDHDLLGMCPDLELLDLRVLDERGESDEFTVLAALQFVRHLNSNKAKPVVHGVNLSMSLIHNVMNYACGRTPVCEECHRLIAAGTVVVAAAGNAGHASFLTSEGASDGYRASSITDPGNADQVITVGATHRNRAFTYGVSYFSSRGPTGDGRVKPDLVAPGEKITSAIPGADLETLDGTSMAAPHVSGAAALLMARHEELVGDPQRIKQILCDTATDLGRERFFQGRGMLDVLRALQSV